MYTLAVTKPDGLAHLPEIMEMIKCWGLTERKVLVRRLTPDDVAFMYPHHAAAKFYPTMAQYLQREAVRISILEGAFAAEVFRELLGSTRPWEAAPNTIRAMFSASLTPQLTINGNIENAEHGSELGHELLEIAHFFPNFDG